MTRYGNGLDVGCETKQVVENNSNDKKKGEIAINWNDYTHIIFGIYTYMHKYFIPNDLFLDLKRVHSIRKH